MGLNEQNYDKAFEQIKCKCPLLLYRDRHNQPQEEIDHADDCPNNPTKKPRAAMILNNSNATNPKLGCLPDKPTP